MENPTNKQTLQKFLSLLSLLLSHIPSISSQAACLYDLQKKVTTFLWLPEHQATFDNLKQIVAANIGLKYYNPSDENIFIEADASGCSFGSCLVQ